MKYLLSIPAEIAADERISRTRQPVIPCFPGMDSGSFLTIPEFRFSSLAEVADVQDDPDELAAALYAEYPGLPRTLHENYILRTFEAVSGMPYGTRLGVSVSQRQASLIDRETGRVTVLWEGQPLS